MIRLTVLYPAKDGETFNYDYYFNDHHKLIVSRWKPEGLVSCEFDKGLSDPGGGKADDCTCECGREYCGSSRCSTCGAGAVAGTEPVASP